MNWIKVNRGILVQTFCALWLYTCTASHTEQKPVLILFQKISNKQKSVKVFFAEIIHEDNSPEDDKENMDDTAVRTETADETEQNQVFFAKFLMDCIEEDIY